MKKHKSSLHMGDNINGYGQQIVLKADPITPPPVSQENVRLTPNFNQYLSKIIFSVPAVNDTNQMDPAMSKIVGSFTAVNRVIFSETTKKGANQSPSLDFQLASSHASVGGNLVTSYAKKDNSDKDKRNGWYEEDGYQVYYKNGKKQKKKYIEEDGCRYYVDSEGHRITGWKTDWGKKYYFRSDGTMVEDQFTKIDEDWYYFDENGVMAKGKFIENGGDIHYVDEDGHLVTGLQTIKKKTYYFDSAGRLQKGQKRINGEQYYFGPDGAQVELYYINEFLFEGTKKKDEKKENEALAEELMILHQKYDEHIAYKRDLATQGSILVCTYGTKLSRLDATEAADICDIGTGLPIMGCNACKEGENIYSFHGCRAPESPDLPMREILDDGYKKCIPLLGHLWIQDDSEQPPVLWNSVSGECSVALTEGGGITCRYGGWIGIVEIPEKETEEKPYVTLEQLDNFNFFMGSTDVERQNNIVELNRVLEKYAITTELRISFFMGQVKQESRSGERTLESYSGSTPEEYFNNKYSNNTTLGNQGGSDGEHFRGAGFLHLTGRYNYQRFADDMGDQEIMIQGYRLVGGTYNRPVQTIESSDVGVIDLGKYAWEASGWYWNYGAEKIGDLNLCADKKDWHSISVGINKDDEDTFPVRNRYINEFYKILTGNTLGLPE